MDKLVRGTILLCLFLLVFPSAFGNGNGNVNEEEGHHDQEILQKKNSVLEMVISRMFPLSTPSFPSPTTTTSYWDTAKTLINRVQAHFFPPNLEGSEEVEASSGRTGEGGGAVGEKVKEAVVKSFVKSKAAVEESAKSAANLAGETVHKTADKIKSTLSESSPHSDDQAEL